ncbi:MAG: sigma-70 family RNA polymerase sigma factor [Phycisphaerales bacterium]|nr:sigma-70 family RNA polymerase sigma factor [Phycisphaerales bacterium]
MSTPDVRELNASAVPAQIDSAQVQVPQRAVVVVDDIDAQLMVLMRDGDRDAGNQLVRRNAERVSRFVARVVRNPRVIEDLTQDVFKNMVRYAARYEPACKFSTWIYRIATNIALDYLDRAAVRKRETAAVSDGETLPDRRSERPDRRMSLDELRAAVAAALESLPPNQRIAITLHQYETMSYEQIAAIMECSVESVRSLLARARVALRERLGGMD